MCCVNHLKHIVVSTFRVGMNELRCEECYKKAVKANETLNALGCILGIVLICFGAFAGWNIWKIGQEAHEQEVRQKAQDRIRDR